MLLPKCTAIHVRVASAPISNLQVSNTGTTKRCTTTPCAPFVPHFATGAGELGVVLLARGVRGGVIIRI